MSIETATRGREGRAGWATTDREVIVVTADEAFVHRVEQSLGDIADVDVTAWVSTTEHEDLVTISGRATAVIVIGPDLEREVVADLATKVRDERPGIPVVIVHAASKQLLLAALRARVHDVIRAEASRDELHHALLGALAAADEPLDTPTARGPKFAPLAWTPGAEDPDQQADHPDDAELDDEDVVDVGAIEAFLAEARAALDHLGDITKPLTTIHTQIDRASAILVNQVAEVTAALERISTEVGD